MCEAEGVLYLSKLGKFKLNGIKHLIFSTCYIIRSLKHVNGIAG